MEEEGGTVLGDGEEHCRGRDHAGRRYEQLGHPKSLIGKFIEGFLVRPRWG
jgi:hypothetical protein